MPETTTQVVPQESTPQPSEAVQPQDPAPEAQAVPAEESRPSSPEPSAPQPDEELKRHNKQVQWLVQQDKALRQRKAEIDARAAEYERWKAEEQTLTSDPVGWFEKRGINPEMLGQMLLRRTGVAEEKKSDEAKPKEDPVVAELKAKLEKFEQERQKEAEEARARAQHQTRAQLLDGISKHYAKDERFEAFGTFADEPIAMNGAVATPAEHVLGYMVSLYQEGGYVPDPSGKYVRVEPGTDLRDPSQKALLDNVVNVVNTRAMDLARRAMSIRALQPKTAAAAVRETESSGPQEKAPMQPKRTITNGSAVVATSGSARRLPSKQEAYQAAIEAMKAARS